MSAHTSTLSGSGTILKRDIPLCPCSYDLEVLSPGDGGPATIAGRVSVPEHVYLERGHTYTLRLDNGDEHDFFTEDDPALEVGAGLPWTYSIMPVERWRRVDYWVDDNREGGTTGRDSTNG